MAETITMRGSSPVAFFEEMFGEKVKLRKEHEFIPEMRLYWATFLEGMKNFLDNLPREMILFLSLLATELPTLFSNLNWSAEKSAASSTSWNRLGEPVGDDKELLSTFSFLSTQTEQTNAEFNNKAFDGSVFVKRIISEVVYRVLAFYEAKILELEEQLERKKVAMQIINEEKSGEEIIVERKTSLISRLSKEFDDVEKELEMMLLLKEKWLGFVEALKKGDQGMSVAITSEAGLTLDPSMAL